MLILWETSLHIYFCQNYTLPKPHSDKINLVYVPILTQNKWATLIKPNYNCPIIELKIYNQICIIKKHFNINNVYVHIYILI